jgi:hypothetical protein
MEGVTYVPRQFCSAVDDVTALGGGQVDGGEGGEGQA